VLLSSTEGRHFSLDSCCHHVCDSWCNCWSPTTHRGGRARRTPTTVSSSKLTHTHTHTHTESTSLPLSAHQTVKLAQLVDRDEMWRGLMRTHTNTHTVLLRTQAHTHSTAEDTVTVLLRTHTLYCWGHTHTLYGWEHTHSLCTWDAPIDRPPIDIGRYSLSADRSVLS